MSDDQKVELVECQGIGGTCFYLNDYRIAGPKPPGGGRTVNRWSVRVKDVQAALKNLTGDSP